MLFIHIIAEDPPNNNMNKNFVKLICRDNVYLMKPLKQTNENLANLRL